MTAPRNVGSGDLSFTTLTLAARRGIFSAGDSHAAPWRRWPRAVVVLSGGAYQQAADRGKKTRQRATWGLPRCSCAYYHRTGGPKRQ